jgi:hypothetical protein
MLDESPAEEPKPLPEKKKKGKLYPDIPVLKSYAGPPPPSFWKCFPKQRERKDKIKVNVRALRGFIQKCWFVWTWEEKNTAKKALKAVQGRMKVKIRGWLGGGEDKECKVSAGARGVCHRHLGRLG